MATLDDLPRMLDEQPAVRDDLISALLGFCARQGVEVSSDELIAQNITDEQISGYRFTLPPGQTDLGIDELPQMLVGEPAVREDLISTLVAFCARHEIEAAPETLVGLAGEGDEVSGYGGYPGFYLGALHAQMIAVPPPPPPPVVTNANIVVVPSTSIVIQIQII